MALLSDDDVFGSAGKSSLLSDDDVFGAPPKKQNKGIVGELGDSLKRGIGSTIDYGKISLTDDKNEIAGIVSENLRNRPAPSAAQQQMQAEIQPYAKEAADAQGIAGNVTAYGKLIGKRAVQLASNPREFAGMMAENLPNSVPGIAGMIAGGYAGGHLGPAGAIAGGIAGGTAGGYKIEQGSSMFDQITKEAQARGIDTNDKAALATMIGEKYPEFLEASRLKGVGTAGTDAALNVATLGVAGAGERMLAKEARGIADLVQAGKITGAESAAAIAGIEAKNAARNTIGQKLIRGTGVTAAEMGGESLSEAAGQQLAYGKLDPLDVIDEGLLAFGQGVGMAAGRKFISPLVGATDKDAVTQEIDRARKIADNLNQTLGGDERTMPTLTTDIDPMHRSVIERVMGLDTSPMSANERAKYEKDLATVFDDASPSETVGYTTDANGHEIPFTMRDYVRSTIAVADMDRANNAAPIAEQAAPPEIPVSNIPVVGPLSKIGNAIDQAQLTQQAVADQSILSGIAKASPAQPEKTMTEAGLEQWMAQYATPEALQRADMKTATGIAARATTQPQPTSTAPLQQTATTLTMPGGIARAAQPIEMAAKEEQANAAQVGPVAATAQGASQAINQLRSEVESADPFSERSADAISRLTSAVTDDAKSSIASGQMPVYRVTDKLAVTISPSAQNPGKFQVTRYSSDGVLGDSQYNSIDEAIQQEGISHKPRMSQQEADNFLGASVSAESKYQQKLNTSPERVKETPKNEQVQLAAKEAKKAANRAKLEQARQARAEKKAAAQASVVSQNPQSVSNKPDSVSPVSNNEPEQSNKPEIVKVKDVYGNYHHVLKRELDSGKTLLRIHTADGERKTGEHTHLNIENIDSDGSKTKEAWKDVSVVAGKNLNGLKTRSAIVAEINRLGQSQEDFDIQQTESGIWYATRKKDTKTEAADAQQKQAEPVASAPAAQPKAEPAKYTGPADVSSRAGQMELANRGGRIATLKMMNEQLRKIAPDEAWADANIEQATDLDALQDSISKALVEAQRGKPEANPLRKELEELSGQELKAVFDKMGLAGKLMAHEERISALLMEDAAEVRAAIKAVSEPAKAQEPQARKQIRAVIVGSFIEFYGDSENVSKIVGKPAADGHVAVSRMSNVSSLINKLSLAGYDVKTVDTRAAAKEPATVDAAKQHGKESFDYGNDSREVGQAIGLLYSTFHNSPRSTGDGFYPIKESDISAAIDAAKKSGVSVEKRANTTYSSVWNFITPAGREYVAYLSPEGRGSWKSLGDAVKQPETKPAEQEAKPSESPKQYNTMADIDSAISGIYDGTISPEDYKAAFRGLLASKEAISGELNKMTKDRLLGRLGPALAYRLKTEKKDAIVDGAFEAIRNTFALRRDFGPNSYSFGAGAYAKYQSDKLTALTEMVEASSAEDLKEFADEIAGDRNQRREKIEAAQDPKTVEDFDNALRLKKSEGLTFAEARMSLTPEQRAEYDRLKGIESRDQRQARADQQKADVRVASQTTGAQIVEGKHSKKGHKLWSVQLADRVDGDSYKTLLSTAKKMGGNYVNQMQAKMWKTVWGFQFTDEARAEAFIKLAAGDKSDAEAKVQERRDAFADDKSQSAVERLNEMADRLDERADESLGRERKANTERRARFAASAENAANAEKAMATTMRRISGAISDGTAQFLDRVRQKAQVEYLAASLRTANDKAIREKYPNYAEQEKHRGEKPTAETADYAEFPQYAMMRSDLANLARQMIRLPNMKMLGQRILKVADDTSAAYNAFAKAHLLEVSRFGKADGSGLATFSTMKDAERSIAVSNLEAVAVPMQIKRGEYRIVLSPSEAINRGIWKGDDRKMTLSPDIGAEIVEKLGRLNRKVGSKRGMYAPPTAPWQFENAYNDRKRLAGMGIEQPWEFRAALREFANLKEAPKERDKIKEMERAMIGRKNDGLDFFPTPEETAKAMIDAAEITEGMSVLEPSAGMGHIAEQIRNAGVDPDVIEFNSDRRELLEAKGFNVVGNDFIEMTPRGFTYGDVFRAPDGTLGVMRGSGGLGSNRVGLDPLDGNGQPDTRRSSWHDRDELVGVEKRASNSGYDRIIMNPPFSGRRDAEHVQHAYSLLRPGGRLVAIMGEGVFFGQDKKAQQFRDWLDEVGGTSEKLEEGTFLDPSLPVNTATNARMVVIQKPETDQGTALYSKSAVIVGDSGLGKIEVKPASSIKPIADILAAENATQVVVKGGNVDALNRVAKLFGKQIIFFRAVDGNQSENGAMGAQPGRTDSGANEQGNRLPEDGYITNGFVNTGRPDTVFLNVDSSNHLLYILGHELGHTLRMDDPKLWASMAKQLQPLIRRWSQYKASMGQSFADESANAEELFGDIIGQNFLNQEFWNELAQENQSLFQKIASTAIKILNKAMSLIAGKDVSIYVSDMKQARAVIAKVMAQYAENKGMYQSLANQYDGDYINKRMVAWHGSPHDHDKFDSSKIGTGEGAQAYGYGHYFAGAKDVAEWYRNNLQKYDAGYAAQLKKEVAEAQSRIDAMNKHAEATSVWVKRDDGGRIVAERTAPATGYTERRLTAADIRKRKVEKEELLALRKDLLQQATSRLAEYEQRKGRLYQVELAPSEDEYLDWDKPLSEQSDTVKAALDKVGLPKKYHSENKTGSEIYRLLSQDSASHITGKLMDGRGDKAASEYLHSLGIRGIRYLDGSSRSKGEGNSNYVIFSDDDVTITAKYNLADKSNLSPADKAIYGMVAEGKSASDILKFIASTSRNPFYRQLAKLLQKTGIAPQMTLGEQSNWKMNAGNDKKYAAAYDPNTNTVALFRAASSERNMLHELMHAATIKALEKNGLASAQMKMLFKHVERNGKSLGLFYDKETGAGIYGMADIDEFVAEAFSNPKFQALLKQVAAPTSSTSTLKNAWHWFVNIVRGILGIPKSQENALSRALEIGLGVMRENMRLNDAQGSGNVRAMPDNSTASGRGNNTPAPEADSGEAKEINGIPVLGLSMQEYISDPQKLIDDLVSSYGDSGMAIGIRGIYEDELGVHEIAASHDNRDGADNSELEGVSTIGITGDWSYDPEQVLKNLPRFASGALKFGDTPYIAVIEGRPSIDDIANDPGEYVMRDAKTIAYIKRKPNEPSASAGSDAGIRGNIAAIDQTDTPNFKRWFGDSVVTHNGKPMSEGGKPLVVYHGTNADFSEFKTTRGGEFGPAIYLTDSPREAGEYGEAIKGVSFSAPPANIMPVYVRIQNPYTKGVDEFWKEFGGTDSDAAGVERAKSAGHDGVIAKRADRYYDNEKYEFVDRGNTLTHYIAFEPTQIKSSIGNNGDFSPTNPDIRYNIADDIRSHVPPMIQKHVSLAFDNQKSTSWLTAVNTQYHKALKWAGEGKPLFKRVFDLGQEFVGDVSRFAVMSQNAAPTMFNEWQSVGDVATAIRNTRSFKDLTGKNAQADIDAAAKPIFDGTLYGGGNPMNGVKFSDAKLRSEYKLTDKQIKLYHEALDAVNVSMDELAKSIIAKHAKNNSLPFDNGMSVEEMAESVSDGLDALREEALMLDDQKAADLLEKTMADVKSLAEKNQKLQDAGYFPLMRFGDHTVTATDAEGKVQYFNKFEGVPLIPKSAQYQMNREAAKLQAEHPEWTVKTGIQNTEAHKMFGGLNIDALKLFADHMDAESKAPYQEFLRVATNDRSVMKRMMHRKGTPGYSEDARRTLASFIVSNARAASSNYHLFDMRKATVDAEQDGGDIGREAVKLFEEVSNPVEAATKLRGFLFFNYLGGSIASAAINMTQIPMMTFPKLSQYAKVNDLVGMLGKAAKMAVMNPANVQGEVGKALRRAELDGVTAPQEIFQLTGTAANSIFTSNKGANFLLQAWGKPFALAESFNRRTTFLAAYQIASKMTPAQLKETGAKSAFEFAETMVKETQGIYNAGNRPNIGRGAVGATMMTFKQYSIMYMELLSRLPLKQQAMMLGMLILAAGAGGLPFEEDAEDIIDTIGQWMGYATNTRKTIRNAVEGAIGKEAADIALNGVMDQMGLSLSARMGMHNLLPGSGILKQSSVDKGRDVQEFFGPAASVIASFGKALENLATGHPDRAALAMAPVAVQNAVRGLNMMNTGYAEDMKGRRTIPVSGMEGFAKSLGFNPKSVAQFGEIKRDLSQDQRLMQVRRESFTSAMADAIISGDMDARNQAISDMKQWNLNNPNHRVMIDMRSVAQRVRAAKMEGVARFLKSTPKTMRADAIEEFAK